MHIKVNGVQLFFDTEGLHYVGNGKSLERRQTLLILHGGPGIDHSPYRALGQRLKEDFQIVYLDQRGSGRSEAGSPDDWTLKTWAEDIYLFCETIGIERPWVLGHSFGGYVAQAFASSYPQYPAGLILAGTAPRFVLPRSLEAFRTLAGDRAVQVAAKFFSNPLANFPEYLNECFPFYSNQPSPPEILDRMIIKVDVAHHFVGGEMQTFDLRERLKLITCPTLVLSGGRDVIATAGDTLDLKQSLQPGIGSFRFFPHSGHEILRDEEDEVVRAIRDFCS